MVLSDDDDGDDGIDEEIIKNSNEETMNTEQTECLVPSVSDGREAMEIEDVTEEEGWTKIRSKRR